MPARPPRQWILIGVACGLVAVFVVRYAVVLVVGSFKVLVVIGALALLWIFLRGPRDGGS